MYICAKFVYKSKFMFVIRITEVNMETFLLQLFREYQKAIKDYKVVDDVLDYIEIEDYYSGEICYPIDECHEIHGTDCPAWKCSVCGDEFPEESNYCSNCGARVDKEKIKYIPDI